jgi:hypothetical protein
LWAAIEANLNFGPKMNGANSDERRGDGEDLIELGSGVEVGLARLI